MACLGGRAEAELLRPRRQPLARWNNAGTRPWTRASCVRARAASRLGVSPRPDPKLSWEGWILSGDIPCSWPWRVGLERCGVVRRRSGTYACDRGSPDDAAERPRVVRLLRRAASRHVDRRLLLANALLGAALRLIGPGDTARSSRCTCRHAALYARGADEADDEYRVVEGLCTTRRTARTHGGSSAKPHSRSRLTGRNLAWPELAA